MHSRVAMWVGAVLVLALLTGAAPAAAQTSDPEGGVICAPSEPCGDAPADALQLGSTTVADVVVVAPEPVIKGLGLGWVVMAILVLALLYAIAAAVAGMLGGPFPLLPGGGGVLLPVLSLVGLGIAIYMTYVETQRVAAVCGPVGDCNAVQESPFATLFGFLPVGLLGVIGYVGIAGAWGLGRFGRDAAAQLGVLALFGMALFGVLFSIYLTYLELFIIKAVCAWCLSSAVIMAALLALAVGPAVRAFAPQET